MAATLHPDGTSDNGHAGPPPGELSPGSLDHWQVNHARQAECCYTQALPPGRPCACSNGTSDSGQTRQVQCHPRQPPCACPRSIAATLPGRRLSHRRPAFSARTRGAPAISRTTARSRGWARGLGAEWLCFARAPVLGPVVLLVLSSRGRWLRTLRLLCLAAAAAAAVLALATSTAVRAQRRRAAKAGEPAAVAAAAVGARRLEQLAEVGIPQSWGGAGVGHGHRQGAADEAAGGAVAGAALPRAGRQLTNRPAPKTADADVREAPACSGESSSAAAAAAVPAEQCRCCLCLFWRGSTTCAHAPCAWSGRPH
eukprot:363606-Chlamydomonas_euryale.AAC.7